VFALRLSYHGYIVVAGEPADQKQASKYLVFYISGDILLSQMLERSSIKGIFLNFTEDQLIIAQNVQIKDTELVKGNIAVLKLYSLQKIGNLSNIIYQETLS
jgi:hypothetical protein